MKNVIFYLVFGALLAWPGGGVVAADNPPQNPGQEDMAEAQREFQEGAGQFNGEKGSETAAQKANKRDYSEAIKQPERRAYPDDPRERALQGSPQTGYAGTWTDPETGDIITSVIPPVRNDASGSYGSAPIIIEPQVGGWGGNWNNAQGNDYPVQGQPVYGPGYYPPGMVNPGANHSYRPLRPGPHHNGSLYNPNQEYNIPGWKPFPPEGNRYPPAPPPHPPGAWNRPTPPPGAWTRPTPPPPGAWNGAPMPPSPQYNIPGWKPFPPAGNRYPTAPPPPGMMGRPMPMGPMMGPGFGPRGGF